jgi:mRNA-degrading endonuclease toxin of MazEF toxin-antitoxin module
MEQWKMEQKRWNLLRAWTLAEELQSGATDGGERVRLLVRPRRAEASSSARVCCVWVG